MNNFDISALNQEEVIKKDHLEDYKNGKYFFFNELVRLNLNIYIMKKIIEFPSLFCDPHDCIFLPMVLNNFFEYSVVIITRILTDEGEGKFTLRRFKNRILQDYVNSEYRSALQERMKSMKFDDATIKISLNKVKALRDKRIAHTIEEFLQNTKDIDLINFKELETLIDYLNRFFKLLSFNVDYLMLPIPYSDKVIHPKDADSRSDIERILDSIAKESGYLTMPEELGKWPGAWEKQKEMMSDEDISILNKYRKKSGLPDF